LCLSLPRAEELRKTRARSEDVDAAARRAQALGDPTRFAVAALLAQAGELCVCDLAWICERSQNLVSHHLRSLRTAGLVAARRDKKMVMYSLTPVGAALVRSVMKVGEEMPT